MIGATNRTSCGCDKGLREDAHNGHCIKCTEGLLCEGMGKVEIAEGYQSAKDHSVFKCQGNYRRLEDSQAKRALLGEQEHVVRNAWMD